MLSVTVFGDQPVPGLEASATPADDGFRYDIGHVKFEERDGKARADVLNAVLDEHVDRLIPVAAELHRPDVFVRFFLTLPHGAETVHADTLKRLASVNATLWIDA